MNRQLVTTETSFCPIGPVEKELRMFKVSADIDAESALEKASNLMQIVLQSIDDAAMGTVKLEGHQAWLTHHAAESCKAIIDALWDTIQLGQYGGAK